MVGDSFINPVKAFSVGPAEEQIVVLEFEVSSDKGFDTGAGGTYICSACVYLCWYYDRLQRKCKTEIKVKKLGRTYVLNFAVICIQCSVCVLV